MMNYTIMVPFSLDWRLVAPRDYETLEYFVTPELSFVFQMITNGRSPFEIGSYFVHIEKKVATREQFMTEIMPQRSKERIREAFRNPEISAFFSLEDALKLKQTFEQEGFICRKVEIMYNGQKAVLHELPPDDFQLMIQESARLHMMIPFDLEFDGVILENMYSEIEAKVTKRIMREQADKEAGRRGMTKKRLTLRGIIGAALLTVSTVSFAFSRRLFSKGGRVGIIGGAACGLVSIVSGILGKQFAEETLDYIRKGVISAYA